MDSNHAMDILAPEMYFHSLPAFLPLFKFFRSIEGINMKRGI